ncbi:MAG: alpha/beta fold hydrolase [Verrucomicrobiota bacterium]|jgi:dienelactone hydrolase
MNKFVSKLIDRWVIRVAASRLPRPTGADPHWEQARRLLESPDFFAEGTPPAAISFTGGKNFQFPSPVVTASPENNLVTGRISRCGKHWRKRPAVVLLHGWNDRWGYRYRFPWLARRFNRRGINSVMFELPYHFQRQPRQGALRNFISEDLGHTMEATHQALADINSVVNWLLAQGCPRVSLLGLSLGAWLGGLTACHNSGLSCAVLITPVSRVDRMIDEVAFCHPIREALMKKPLDLHRLNLAFHKPKLTRGFILVVEAEHDVFVPAETTQELWQSWGNPELWSLPYGHITVLSSSSMFKRASKWIGLRMKIPESPHEAIRPDWTLM